MSAVRGGTKPQTARNPGHPGFRAIWHPGAWWHETPDIWGCVPFGTGCWMARNPRYLGFRAAGVLCRRAPLQWHETPDVRGFVPGCPGFRSTPHLGAQLVLGVRLSVDPLSLSVEYSAFANENRVAYWTQDQVTLNCCVGCDLGWGFVPPPLWCVGKWTATESVD